MAYVVLFGGGDAGGVILTEHGVKPIPPWKPFWLAELRALSALVAARVASGRGKLRRDLDPQIEKLNGAVLEAATHDFGSLGNGGILFEADGDGVYCGSTGPVHIPIHRTAAAA
ncbi:MAG TPA: hypothetical protein VGC56_14510 [Allosphingosinicella sp.]|jgi:hypothetical protein